MILFSVFSIFPSLFALVTGGKLPEPEVKIEVVHKPFMCYRKSKYGDMLLVHYEGFLESNGTMFHSRQGLNYSCSRKQGDKNPVWFTLGIREVLKGWDKGLQNMCTGERRKLTVPPSLAYGKEGKGKIPPNSALIFDIELMDIKNGPRSHESFREMDLNDDWKLSRNEVKEYIKKEFEKHGYFPNDTHHEVMVDDIFKNEDEDKDGFISAREFTYQHDEL
ncbi:peptidyl-prolyl cis-trans isomerase FKBP14 isoform X2 [Echeneis naucrates]|uniref:peptidyl-prolyl cis-trans isomerase FKBP14 isoform X2 n=1 Tax=Echeneis naucrates TaxID=173247 RepID=UPI0011133B26|nr:peptidyl-prolyl cis-trans isomerase FKBP14-like isoform X2 [Echeneis naucrates]